MFSAIVAIPTIQSALLAMHWKNRPTNSHATGLVLESHDRGSAERTGCSERQAHNADQCDAQQA